MRIFTVICLATTFSNACLAAWEPHRQPDPYASAVQSLSKMECPRFKGIRGEDVASVFMMTSAKEMHEFFKRLQEDVAKASDQKVILSRGASEDFDIAVVFTPLKRYYRATQGSQSLPFMFVPGATPFLCESEPKAASQLAPVAEPCKIVEKAGASGNGSFAIQIYDRIVSADRAHYQQAIESVLKRADQVPSDTAHERTYSYSDCPAGANSSKCYSFSTHKAAELALDALNDAGVCD